MSRERRTAITIGRAIAWMLSLAAVTGCRLPFAPTAASKVPTVLTAQPTAQELAMAVTTNAARVHQVQSQLRMTLQDLPGLSGQLVFERPRRLRIQAALLGVGGPGVDVGSNDTDFWMWFKTSFSAAGPMFVHANHDRFAETLTQQRLPLQPEWISDAIGLTTLPPEASLEGPYVRNDKNFELRVRTSVPSGTLTRVLVIERGTARVLEQHWYDDSQRALAVAQATDFDYLDPPGVNLPRRVVLTLAPYTPDQMTLTLQMSGLRVNQLAVSPSMWEMPDPGNVSRIDLGSPGAWLTGASASVAPETIPFPVADPTSAAFRPQYRGRTFR